jgi:uncharacterized SAM-binding protein YcdF (DUF218 family)
MYELVKSLSLLFYPLGMASVLLLLALLLLWRRRYRAGGASLSLGLLVLWAFSTPLLADRLVAALEKDWPDLPVAQVSSADAILVLGGAFSTGNGQFTYPSAGTAVDRYWHAARLFHAGRAPRVITSGGRPPHRTGGMTEAEAGAVFLADMGVPSDAMIIEPRALTTRDHVIQLAPILERHNISSLLVVTSASHMRRAVATLSHLDVPIIPVATGFSVVYTHEFRLKRLLPSAGALVRSTRAMHEFIGLLYYRWMGWA